MNDLKTYVNDSGLEFLAEDPIKGDLYMVKPLPNVTVNGLGFYQTKYSIPEDAWRGTATPDEIRASIRAEYPNRTLSDDDCVKIYNARRKLQDKLVEFGANYYQKGETDESNALYMSMLNDIQDLARITHDNWLLAHSGELLNSMLGMYSKPAEERLRVKIAQMLADEADFLQRMNNTRRLYGGESYYAKIALDEHEAHRAEMYKKYGKLYEEYTRPVISQGYAPVQNSVSEDEAARYRALMNWADQTYLNTGRGDYGWGNPYDREAVKSHLLSRRVNALDGPVSAALIAATGGTSGPALLAGGVGAEVAMPVLGTAGYYIDRDLFGGNGATGEFLGNLAGGIVGYGAGVKYLGRPMTRMFNSAERFAANRGATSVLYPGTGYTGFTPGGPAYTYGQYGDMFYTGRLLPSSALRVYSTWPTNVPLPVRISDEGLPTDLAGNVHSSYRFLPRDVNVGPGGYEPGNAGGGSGGAVGASRTTNTKVGDTGTGEPAKKPATVVLYGEPLTKAPEPGTTIYDDFTNATYNVDGVDTLGYVLVTNVNSGTKGSINPADIGYYRPVYEVPTPPPFTEPTTVVTDGNVGVAGGELPPTFIDPVFKEPTLLLEPAATENLVVMSPLSQSLSALTDPRITPVLGDGHIKVPSVENMVNEALNRPNPFASEVPKEQPRWGFDYEYSNGTSGTSTNDNVTYSTTNLFDEPRPPKFNPQADGNTNGNANGGTNGGGTNGGGNGLPTLEDLGILSEGSSADYSGNYDLTKTRYYYSSPETIRSITINGQKYYPISSRGSIVRARTRIDGKEVVKTIDLEKLEAASRSGDPNAPRVNYSLEEGPKYHMVKGPSDWNYGDAALLPIGDATFYPIGTGSRFSSGHTLYEQPSWWIRTGWPLFKFGIPALGTAAGLGYGAYKLIKGSEDAKGTDVVATTKINNDTVAPPVQVKRSILKEVPNNDADYVDASKGTNAVDSYKQLQNSLPQDTVSGTRYMILGRAFDLWALNASPDDKYIITASNITNSGSNEELFEMLDDWYEEHGKELNIQLPK